MNKNLNKILLLFITILVVLSITQPVHAGEWPMFMHDPAHSGMADETVEPPLGVLWKYDIGFSGTEGSPAVSNGIVGVGSLIEKK